MHVKWPSACLGFVKCGNNGAMQAGFHMLRKFCQLQVQLNSSMPGFEDTEASIKLTTLEKQSILFGRQFQIRNLSMICFVKRYLNVFFFGECVKW